MDTEAIPIDSWHQNDYHMVLYEGAQTTADGVGTQIFVYEDDNRPLDGEIRLTS